MSVQPADQEFVPGTLRRAVRAYPVRQRPPVPQSPLVKGYGNGYGEMLTWRPAWAADPDNPFGTFLTLLLGGFLGFVSGTKAK